MKIKFSSDDHLPLNKQLKFITLTIIFALKIKAAKYYQANKDVIKEKANSKYNNLLKDEKKKQKKSIARVFIKMK